LAPNIRDPKEIKKEPLIRIVFKKYIYYKSSKYHDYYYICSKKAMGELEELILLIVGIMNGKAYGFGIIEELERRTGRSVAIGAAQTVLKRMEDKGWVTSKFGEATKERGGKRKRYYTITAKGRKIAAESRENRNSLWEAMPKLGLNYGSV
jgi:DNA-binding PadR family transcriptional regulator